MFDLDLRHKKALKLKLVLMILGVVFAGAALLASIQFFNTRQNQNNFAEFVVKNVAQIEKNKLRTVIQELESSIKVIRDWGVSGLLRLEDAKTLNIKIFPLFKKQDIVQALFIASQDGKQYMVFNRGKIKTTLLVTGNGNSQKITIQEWDGPDRAISTRTVSAHPTDMLRRKLLQEAGGWKASDDAVHWTSAVRDDATGKYMVAAEIVWVSEKDGRRYVAGILMNLGDILDSVTKSGHSAPGIPFLVDTDDWQVLARERASIRVSDREITVNVHELLSSAMKVWREDGHFPQQPERFFWNGTNWWIVLSRVTEAGQGGVMLGTVIPESMLKEMLNVSGGSPMLFYLVVLLGCAILIIWLIWRDGAALFGRGRGASDGSSTPTESDIKALIDEGEGSRTEFKSTMRKNLHTGKFGKEIELAWLKAVASFMNSKGGTLLIGVDDSGRVLGLDEDEFENSDRLGLHFKNLINQHIGAEFFQLIDFHICEVDGKDVAVVRVSSSDRPVFLKTGKEESFWVRSGPSNMQLSISRAIKYIEDRKKHRKK